MPRKPTPQTTATDVVIDSQAVAQLSDSANALVALTQEQDALVRATAATLGYQLPANATDPDLIQRDISANMRRSVEACLEVGRGLAVLKEACAHGKYLPRLEALGIDPSVAVRFIQAATKFSNAASTQHLIKAIGNQTKLFEMLVLDDEQIEELSLTGQTGELHLDDVAIMSVKELRAAVREERHERQAGEKVRADMSAKLTKLQVQLKKKVVADTDWPDALAPLCEQVAAAGRDFVHAISKLEVARITAFDTGSTLGEEEQAKYEAALKYVADVHATALASARKALDKEELEFGQTLGNFASES
ncbi:hypothetical protein [Limnohabitans sp.]|uniref:hypothetical protein n=1 Tax=Limnohabitans sp. TaxID=1907725 RepID=UPI00286EB7CC|nr:hypothetical protein [Limnohabitans sp.]